jgi:hypothetical protein
MSKPKLDTDKIARGLGARRKGKVYSTGGYPGAAQLASEVQARFRVPPGGGRATDPGWSDKRLVPIAPRTLKRLERIAKRLHEATGIRVEPMQLAAILLETTTKNIGAEDAERLVTCHGRTPRS